MKIIYSMLVSLFITSGMYGMQEQKQVQAAQQENKEAKAKTFEEILHEEDVQRINKRYEDFYAVAKKFINERCIPAKLSRHVESVIESGFLLQAHILGTAILFKKDETIKMNTERRLNTLIAFGKWLFGLPAAQDERIVLICRVILNYLSSSFSIHELPRQFDGIAIDLFNTKYGVDEQPLVESEVAKKLADAFYGWLSL